MCILLYAIEVTNVLKDDRHQSSAKQGFERNAHRGSVSWVEIESEWAYWIDPQSFNLKRVKKRVPVDAIIVVKSREKLDDERTYVNASYGVVIETGIAELTKKEASDILARQVAEYMRFTEHWPPFTSTKRTLKSEDVEISFEPTEYDSFTLLMTRKIIGADPSKFLSSLKKHEVPQDPLWRVETAKSGRAKCRSCKDVILEGRFRIGEPYFYEGSLSYRWYHPRCVATRIDANEVKILDGYSKLRPEEKQRLKRLLTQ